MNALRIIEVELERWGSRRAMIVGVALYVCVMVCFVCDCGNHHREACSSCRFCDW